jgi:hypothetical protein
MSQQDDRVGAAAVFPLAFTRFASTVGSQLFLFRISAI